MKDLPLTDKEIFTEIYKLSPASFALDRYHVLCKAQLDKAMPLIAQEIKEELDGMACTFDPYNNEITINLTMDKWQSFWDKKKA